MRNIDKKALMDLFETGKKPTGESFAALIEALCDEINHQPKILKYNLYKKSEAKNPYTVFNVPGIKKDNFWVIPFANGWAWKPTEFSCTIDEELETLTAYRNSGTADDIILNIIVFS